MKLIEGFCTGRAGLKKSQAIALGIRYPLKKGWKKRLEGTRITNGDYVKLIELKTIG